MLYLGTGTLESIRTSLETISNFIDLITHPIKLAILFWNWTVEWSYILFFLIAAFAVLTYILGFKKYAKLAPASIIIYMILQAIGKVPVK